MTSNESIDDDVYTSNHLMRVSGDGWRMQQSREALTRESSRVERAMWVAVIAASGIGLSLVFACVTPFAALATVAALHLRADERWAVIGFVWLANQIVGFGILGYPLTWECAAWGGAIGLSATLAVVAAWALSTTRPAPLAVSLPFVGAFAAFEAGLYAAGWMLPAGGDVFGLAVIRHVFWVNAAALCGLMAVHQVLSLVGGVFVAKLPPPFAGAIQ